MKVLMLDVLRVEDVDDIEAVRRIRAGVAVEAPLTANQNPAPPESAMLDCSRNTATKPNPQPRPTPQREKRRKRRLS
jgi:hypothetical protein